jgi:hypothetical protein
MAVAIVIAVAGAYLGSWLMTPVGTAPGSPLRMVDAQGSDLGVAALTVTDGPDKRWFRLGDAALGQVPYRLLNILGTFHMGAGQDDAQNSGVAAAGRLMNRGDLEKPVGVSPGVVNGTSSGLAWAIATLLLNDPALRGGDVYATGALFGEDMVASVGGLAAKLQTPGLSEASTVFVPRSQYRQAWNELHLSGNGQIAGRLVGVATVSEALEVLCREKRKAKTCRQLRKQQADRRDAAVAATNTEPGRQVA